MASDTSFDGFMPSDVAWVGPINENLLETIRNGQSPYLFLVEVVHKLFHPAVLPHFRTQLYFHLGLFSVCSLLIVLGLLMRLRQGRLWVFHRLDRTILIPNASTLFGVCALIYAGLGFWLIAATIKISEGAGLPHYYTGLRVAWFGAIWTGAFFEIWTTVAGWYVRKYGANHRESTLRSFIAVAIPATVVLVAWIPPIILCIPHGQTFNRSFRVSQKVTAQLLEWQKSWLPGDGIDLAKMYALVEPGAELGNELRKSHRLKQICSYYCTAVLFLTFVCYVTTASLEIIQLTRTVNELRTVTAQRVSQIGSHKESTYPPPPSPPLKSTLGLEPDQVASPAAAAAVPELAYRPSTTSTPRGKREPQYSSSGTASQGSQQHDHRAHAPWALLAWVLRNRIYSAVCIASMLVAQASLDLWRAVSPLNLRYPSSQFQVEILVMCWVHGILSTAVSLLLLFRSLDTAESRFLAHVWAVCPWMPFPPSMSTSTSKAKNSSSSGGSSDEPPMYATQSTPAIISTAGIHHPVVAPPLGPIALSLSPASMSPPAVDAQSKQLPPAPHVLGAHDDLDEAERYAGSPALQGHESPEMQRGDSRDSDHSYLDAIERARERWIPSRPTQ
ncbi:hypothetical protein JCM3774_000525 [Rhodotorula dairenensis]